MEQVHGRAPWVALSVLGTGLFMTVLDTTIVHVALPAMMHGLATDLDHVLWVVNAYLISYAVFMIPAGRLGTRYGPKRIHLTGLALFTLSSALCGCAGSIGQLLAWRALQGLGAALVTPQIGAFVAVLFPSHRRGAAFGALTSVMGLSIVAGPLLGGLLVTGIGWQWIFAINVPAGIAVLVLSFVLLPAPPPSGRRGADPLGVALVTVGLTSLTFALLGTGHPLRGQALCAGLGCLVLFFVQQRCDTRSPLLPRTLFARRDFVLANGIGAALHFAVIGSATPIALFLQQQLGRTALQSALLTAPTPLAAAAAAHVSGRLADRIGGKPLVIGGLLTYAYGLALLGSQARPGMDPWELLPAMLLADLGIGAALAPLTTLAMAAVDSRHAGPASGVLNTSRQIGGILGGAAVGALITRQTTSAATPSAGSGHATGAATAAADYASALHTTTLLTTGVLFLAAISAAALAPAAGLPRRQRPRRTAFLRLDTLPVVVHGSHGYGAVQILTAIRVGARGRREVIGFELAGSDASASWSRLLTGLHSRGLASIRHVVCGEAPGLSAAVAAVLRLPTRPASAAHDPAAQLRRTLRHHLDTDGPACTRAGLAATVQEAIAVQNSRWATPPRPRRRLRRPSASP
ncbi:MULTISPECIES: DHA2 family efflux MFS transporter permease subunit [unclassified Streptomyces]|uniref:DHA2 family efflux MFS transporter permease subunit n=1 Tax=Streptomyces sp. NBC_00060 TaxID=2975636 RepID=A0AAU2GV21_9ACTN